jgi:hypothetical protein
MEHNEGLVQGFPISSSSFSFTIDGVVKRADERLAAMGGCARFAMDDGYLVGPPEIVFEVLAEFARSLKKESGCELNIGKCKMYSCEEEACERARRQGLIPDELQHL